MGYFVSRQKVWPSGEPVVEIAGCLDAAGPDMMVPYFRKEGDGGEFDDPREAASAAIRVRDAWWAGGKNPYLKDWSKVVINEFETDADVLAWSERAFARIPKCVECGEPIYRETWYPEDCFKDDAFACCSGRCAEQHNEIEEGSGG